MSVATVPSAGPPPEKKFRMSLPTQVVVERPLFDCATTSDNGGGIPLPTQVVVERPLFEGATTSDNGSASPAGPASARSSNGSSNALPPGEELDDAPNKMFDEGDKGALLDTGSLMEMISQSMLPMLKDFPNLPLGGRELPLKHSGSPAPATAPIPGALAVANSPTAALFAEDDWSWHRNPAAAIRSGGTNKQTPVWKYFVYNKNENLSRCIVGNCTYNLKGPHTSTLACHLKKHPVEYAEFQKLKIEYTRERNGANGGGQNTNGPSSPSSSASGSTSSGGGGGNSNNSNGGSKTPNSSKQPNFVIKTEKFADVNANGLGHLNNNSKSSGKGASNLANLLNGRGAPNAAATAAMLNGFMPGFGMPFPFNAGMPPNSTAAAANLAAQAALTSNILKQHGMAIGADGQLCYTKKWGREERKQKEMELRLALTLSASRIDSSLVLDPIFRDFLEAMQPKFNIPENTVVIDELISTHFHRTAGSIRLHLSNAKKLSLMLDFTKVPAHKLDAEETVRMVAATAFYSAASQKMEVVLLGVKTIDTEEEIEAGIKNSLNQVLSDFDLSLDRVSRIVTSGLAEVTQEKMFEKQLEAHSQKLSQSLMDVVENSTSIEELKKAFYLMIISFVTRPEAIQALNQAAGREVTLPIADSFLAPIDAVLSLRSEISLAAAQVATFAKPLDTLSETQWDQLQSISGLLDLFRKHTQTGVSGEFATIDSIVPSLMQLSMSLEKNYDNLADLASELRAELLARSACVLNVNSTQLDGTFLQATALNPALAVLLDDDQLAYAKAEIEKVINDRMRAAEEAASKTNKIKSGLGVDALLASVIDRQTGVAATVTSPDNATNSLYPDLMQAAALKRKQQDRPQNGKNRYAEALVQSYFDEIGNTEEPTTPFSPSSVTFACRKLPPLVFWQLNSSKCPPLAELALELLTIPAATVSFDKIFAGALGAINEDSVNLERDAFLRFNRAHIPRV